MVIWLRNPDAQGEGLGHGVGLNDDIVRAEDLGTIVELDAAYADLSRQRDALLAEARAQAQAILDAAQAEADDLVMQAQMTYTSASHMGYEAGWEQSLVDWHEKMLQAQAEGPSIGQRQRDRLAQLVALGVEQIVATADPAALFRKAGQTIDRIVADGSPVKVGVHPADYEAAVAAFDAVAREWRETGRSVSIQVDADARRPRGTCLCETDLGAVDASLPQQLAAIRAALTRAVQSLPDEEFEDRPDADAAPEGDAGNDDAALRYDDADEPQPASQDGDFAYDAAAATTEHAAADASFDEDAEEQDFFADAAASVEHSHEHAHAAEFAASEDQAEAQPDLA